MSIWCSGEEVGFDEDREQPGPVGGQVRSYATGWSNHYPTTDGDVEQPASVGLATIPPWCVPGHRDSTDDWPCTGPWVRLDVAGREHDPRTTKATGRVEFVSVVLDIGAALELARQLTEWANGEHVYPVEVDDE